MEKLEKNEDVMGKEIFKNLNPSIILTYYGWKEEMVIGKVLESSKDLLEGIVEPENKMKVIFHRICRNETRENWVIGQLKRFLGG